MTYLALLRGVNVGGKAKLSMTELREALSPKLEDVKTYIQSGNIIFSSKTTDTLKLAKLISEVIKTSFKLDVDVVVYSQKQWQAVVDKAPTWWGKDTTWKHNLIAMIPPYDMKATIEAIGTLKPDIERIEAADGIIYQSLSWDKFGKTTSGKLSSSPIYKKMTIRNYNTATKLLGLMA